jgi:hypothetical protein
MPTDPTGTDRQPMDPSRSISPGELSRQLTDAERLILPMPPGPRPGQTCLYRGGEVLYADPAAIDRLETGVWNVYNSPPAPTKFYLRSLAELANASIRWPSPFNSDAC